MEEELSALISQAQAGEREVFGRIYQIFLKRIYRFVFYKIGDRALAEDLVQTTFLKAWEALPRFSQKKGTFQAYLFRIAHNLVVDQFRKKREVSWEFWMEPAAADSLEAEAESESQKEFLRNYLSRLEAEDLELLSLHFFEEMPMSEVAEVVGKSEGAVRVKVFRLLKDLRKKMENNYGNKKSGRNN